MPVQLPAGSFSLPPLGGRLLLFYRILWWALAASACATLIWTWIDLNSAVGIAIIRTAKAAVLIAVSAILYRRRCNDPIAAMLATAFLLWTISSSVDFVTDSPLPALVDRFRFLFFALALLLFPDGAWRPGWTRYVGAAIAATCLLGVGEASGILASEVFLPIAIGCVLAALVALLTRYRTLDEGAQKQQLKWVILGLVCGIALILSARGGAAVARTMAMPAFGAIVLEGVFQLGIVVIALGFLTSLLRYRLYDAESAISRSAVYAALTMALVGTFATCEVLFEIVGDRYFGMATGNLSSAIAAGIAAVLLTPLHGRISDWAEQHFQHDLVALKHELPDLLTVLSSTASVKRLAAAIMPQIGEAVHATRMALLVDGKLRATEGISEASARRLLANWTPPKTDDLEDRDDQASFPLRIALRCPMGEIRAWLLLGPRPDGSFYGKDDLTAMVEIVPPLQRTLFVVVEREAEKLRHQRQIRSFKSAIVGLEQRLLMIEDSKGKKRRAC